jgi:hypothetical protein
MANRTIAQIARDIRADWKDPYFGAVPYLQAMNSLESADDSYGDDSARSIINYFLANASTWRGEKAREIKKELNNLIKR